MHARQQNNAETGVTSERPVLLSFPGGVVKPHEAERWQRYLFHCSFFYDQSQWGGCFYPTHYHFSLLLHVLYVIAIANVEHSVR